MLSFKDGVVIHWNPALDKIQRVATSVFGRYQLSVVVTSGRDGHHKVGSKHGEDKALDLRTWHITGQPNPCLRLEDRSVACIKIQGDLKSALGPRFDVVFETDLFVDGIHKRPQHFHIEEDPK